MQRSPDGRGGQWSGLNAGIERLPRHRPRYTSRLDPAFHTSGRAASASGSSIPLLRASQGCHTMASGQGLRRGRTVSEQLASLDPVPWPVRHTLAYGQGCGTRTRSFMPSDPPHVHPRVVQGVLCKRNTLATTEPSKRPQPYLLRRRFRGSVGRFRGSVGRFRGSTRRFRGSTRRFRGSTRCFRGSTGRFRGSTRRFRGNPERFRGSVGRFRGTLRRFRGSAGRWVQRSRRYIIFVPPQPELGGGWDELL